MEEKLKKLFDYQKFAQNPHLSEVIKASLSIASEQTVELADDALFSVAGGQGGYENLINKNKEKIDNKK